MKECSTGKVLRWIAAAVILAIIVVSVVRVRSCRRAREERIDAIFGEQ